jgi:hypothetical protein
MEAGDGAISTVAFEGGSAVTGESAVAESLSGNGVAAREV